MPTFVNRKSLIVNRKKQNLQTTNDERRTTNQLGFSQIILPLFLLAAIGLSVYLVQQRTNLIPFAQETNIKQPDNCEKITPDKNSRYICYKKTADNNASADCMPSLEEKPWDAQHFPTKEAAQQFKFKEVGYTWSNGWRSFTLKGALTADGDRLGIGSGGYQGKAEARFDGAGKSYLAKESKQLTNSKYILTEYADGITEYSYFDEEVNFQGIAGKTYFPDKSFAFIPKPNTNADCGPGGGSAATKKGLEENCPNGKNDCKSGVCTNGKCVQGAKKVNDSCTYGDECASNKCNNKKCEATTLLKGGENCQNGPQCVSGTCTQGKCAGGSGGTGSTCTKPGDCASNKCTAGKCEAGLAGNNTTNNTTRNGTNNTTNNTTTNNTTRNGTTNNTSGGSNNTTTTNNTTSGGTVPVSLTKAEITNFKANFDAFYPRLGTAKDTGNLNIVSTIANTELASIVSQLSQCPDDAGVGPCVDSKFRTRFDLAKTAARLSAFYATFNGVKGACVKADLGLNPLISATSQAGSTGRVHLCTDRLVASRIWMVFAGGKFVPVLSTDTKYPQNPTCANLPQDVMTHFRQAEDLFKNQAGFVQNTVCDGKTTVTAAGGGI